MKKTDKTGEIKIKAKSVGLATKKQRKPRKMNPNSLANLKMFKKGQSGNPKGKAKGKIDRSTALNKFLDLTVKVFNEDDDGNPIFENLDKELYMTVEESLALAMIFEAKNGNVSAWSQIQDTVYGKQANVTELSGKDGKPIQTENAIRIILPDDSEPENSDV